jgi:hypothetical protein
MTELINWLNEEVKISSNIYLKYSQIHTSESSELNFLDRKTAK